MKPRLLDLCCCAGGAAAGYDRAGFDVYGVDMAGKYAKRYPFPFLKADALWVLGVLIAGDKVCFTHKDGAREWLGLSDFAAIHVSPPCQYYTRGNARLRDFDTTDSAVPIPTHINGWPRLIPRFRNLLTRTGLPYVIENVADAGWDMVDPITLCGCMFNLSTIDTDGVRIHLKRPRLFETNWPLAAPRPCDHAGITQWAGAYGGARRDKVEARTIRKGGYVPPDMHVVKALLGIDPDHDMTWESLYESIPPAYSCHIGTSLANAIDIQNIPSIGGTL